MFEGVIRILAGLQPDPNANAEQQYRWDRRIGLTLTAVIITGVIFAFSLAVAFGMVPKVAPGFMSAASIKTATEPLKEQVQDVQSQLSLVSNDEKRRWSLQLSNALIDARAKECHSKTDEGRRLYYNSIQRMMDDYRELAGDSYQLPACSDL